MAETWRAFANRSQGARAVGGVLTVTDGVMAFTPNFFDIRTGGLPWSAPLSSVAGFGKEPGSFTLGNLFSGGLRARLAVDLNDGTRERFVVNGLDAKIAELTALLGG